MCTDWAKFELFTAVYWTILFLLGCNGALGERFQPFNQCSDWNLPYRIPEDWNSLYRLNWLLIWSKSNVCDSSLEEWWTVSLCSTQTVVIDAYTAHFSLPCFCSLAGQGRFGSVWKGTVSDQEVAVKIFPSHYRNYFYNERDIYCLPFMDSPSLLTYFGQDLAMWMFNVPEDVRFSLSFLIYANHMLCLQVILKERV